MDYVSSAGLKGWLKMANLKVTYTKTKPKKTKAIVVRGQQGYGPIAVDKDAARLYRERQKERDETLIPCPDCGRMRVDPNRKHYADQKNKIHCRKFIDFGAFIDFERQHEER